MLCTDPQDGTTLSACTPPNIKAKILVHTLPNIKAEIPIHTPPLRTLCEIDNGILPDLVDPVHPATPVCTDSTLSAAQILANLANGGVVSGPDEGVESIELQLEVSTATDDDQNKTRVKKRRK